MLHFSGPQIIPNLQDLKTTLKMNRANKESPKKAAMLSKVCLIDLVMYLLLFIGCQLSLNQVF